MKPDPTGIVTTDAASAAVAHAWLPLALAMPATMPSPFTKQRMSPVGSPEPPPTGAGCSTKAEPPSVMFFIARSDAIAVSILAMGAGKSLAATAGAWRETVGPSRTAFQRAGKRGSGAEAEEKGGRGHPKDCAGRVRLPDAAGEQKAPKLWDAPASARDGPAAPHPPSSHALT